MLRSVRADQVTLGMYIRRFEGSWFYHPFWRARFVVRTERVLARIRDSGVGAVIDTDKGTDIAVETAVPEPAMTALADIVAPAPVAPLQRLQRLIPEAPAPASPLPQRPVRAAARIAAPRAFGQADKARAVALAQRSSKVVKALFENCELGRAVSTAPILSVVDDIGSTLEQSSGAFISVTRLRTKDDAIYTHSVAVCALMIGLAREAGAAPSAVQALGTAGLLHDIGKLAIDEGILRKSERSEDEAAEFRRHPELGHKMLSAESGLPPVALDVCLHHHERLDGSGYPFGRKGDKLGQAARMAMICDVYDTMTSSGDGEWGLPPTEAIAHMDEKGGEFDGALLFKFMRSIGVFPAGKLVRLRSNRLAIILPSAGEDRRPLARAFYATVETCFVPWQDVVLSDSWSDEQAVSAEDPARWFTEDWAAMRDRIMAGELPLAA